MEKEKIKRWSELNKFYTDAATTLATNLLTIKKLLEGDGFAEIHNSVELSENLAAITAALSKAGTNYTNKLTSIYNVHVNKKGDVTIDELHIFMYCIQEYNNLSVDMINTFVSYVRMLVNMKEREIEKLKETHECNVTVN